MERSAVLILTVIFFVIFAILAYYGARVTAWSAIIFGIFVALLLLNIFYPPGRAATDTADAWLVVYGIIEIVGLLILGVWIAVKSLTDVRCTCHGTDCLAFD